ncbi:MAG: IS5 family transposase [Planctomycetota bacterium]
MGRARCLEGHLASSARRPRREGPPRLGGDVSRRDLRGREKRGDAVGLTKRGKGSKLAVLVVGEGFPVGVQLAAANEGETSLAQPTVEEVARLAGDDPTCWPVRIIADKGYDSDELRAAFASVGIQLLAPHRSNRTAKSRSNDGRCMRRYKRRWVVERFFAWLNGFRRLIVRHERHSLMYRAFVHVACVLVSMRAL